MELLPGELFRTRPVLSVAYAQALLNTGKLEAAHQTFFDGMTATQRAGNNLGMIQGVFVLADIKMTLGHLREALSSCAYALQLAMAHGKPEPVGTEEVYISLSALHREQGDLKAAAQDLRTGRKLGEQVKVPDWQCAAIWLVR